MLQHLIYYYCAVSDLSIIAVLYVAIRRVKGSFILKKPLLIWALFNTIAAIIGIYFDFTFRNRLPIINCCALANFLLLTYFIIGQYQFRFKQLLLFMLSAISTILFFQNINWQGANILIWKTLTLLTITLALASLLRYLLSDGHKTKRIYAAMNALILVDGISTLIYLHFINYFIIEGMPNYQVYFPLLFASVHFGINVFIIKISTNGK